MFGFRCLILQKCGAGGKKTTGFFHHSQVEKTRIIPKDCEIINMKTRKSKKKIQKMYYLSADSQYFWVVKKIDIFLGVLIFFFSVVRNMHLELKCFYFLASLRVYIAFIISIGWIFDFQNQRIWFDFLNAWGWQYIL